MSTAASDAVILPTPWTTLRESPPGWLYASGFKLGVGEAFEFPFAEIFDPFNETTSTSVATRLESAATSRTDTSVSCTVDDLLSSSWSVHRRNLCNRLLHRKHWWKVRSYYFGSCMHVWCNKPYRCYGTGTIEKLFGSQQLKH